MASTNTIDVKHGDATLITLNLGRDLSAVTSATAYVAEKPGADLIIDRECTITDAESGTVTLQLQVADFDVDKLQADKVYLAEVSTMPGPLTHPNTADAPYVAIRVIQDLG